MTGIRNSLLTLLRTPVKTILFFLLLTFTVALVCAGGNLRRLCAANMERFETIFTTIGTVEQRPEKTIEVGEWKADKKDYRYRSRPVYGETVPLSVLDFEGANYISEPEHRAYYASVAGDYKIKEDIEGMWFSMIVEASPVEDCVPSDRVLMEMKKMVYAYYPVSMPTFYFCDHFEAHPQKLYADKTYIMALTYRPAHQRTTAGETEYVPSSGPYSTQTDREGNRLPSDMTGLAVEEVTPGFYETKRGKEWLALCEELRLSYEFLPVTATQDLNLIMAFYAKEAHVTEGEVFSEEDYRQGNRVCLVSDGFARRNHIKVGDRLHLALRFADYSTSAYRGWGEQGLTAEGGNYEVFEESDYTIKGIYTALSGARGDGYLLERNEVFIPTASIQNSDENNIAAFGPMKGYNTSFRIPNGRESIENYKALWEAQNVPYVNISFYDGGFCQLEEGLENMERMSVILLIAGIVSAVSIVIFFCHLFIAKQKKRTAIERSLGLKKRQCVTSLLVGILVISLCGCTAGAFFGQLFAKRAAGEMLKTQEFDRRFSNSGMQAQENVQQITYLLDMDTRVSAAAGSLVFVFTFAVADRKSVV